MSKTYHGSQDYRGTKLDGEKDLLNKFNLSIPAIPLSSGLLSFGFGPCLSWANTELNQPLQKYSASGLDTAIGTLHCSSGGTPLADALTESQHEFLANAPGNIALLIFSDGMDNRNSIFVAETLKAQYGDRLCIHTVWIGNEKDRQGQANLQQITDIGSCGFASSPPTSPTQLELKMAIL